MRKTIVSILTLILSVQVYSQEVTLFQQELTSFDSIKTVNFDNRQKRLANTNNEDLTNQKNAAQNRTLKTSTNISLSKEDEIIIYPNPTSSIVTVKTPNLKGNILLSIYNSSGQNIYSQGVNQDDLKLDFSSFNSGIYMIHITSEKMNKLFKIVKE